MDYLKNYQPAENKQNHFRLPDFSIKFKNGLTFSKNVVFICFNESPLKMMRNGFYFMLTL